MTLYILPLASECNEQRSLSSNLDLGTYPCLLFVVSEIPLQKGSPLHSYYRGTTRTYTHKSHSHKMVWAPLGRRPGGLEAVGLMSRLLEAV